MKEEKMEKRRSSKQFNTTRIMRKGEQKSNEVQKGNIYIYIF